jgi:tetratricopeptide (TPR) repeat protein
MVFTTHQDLLLARIDAEFTTAYAAANLEEKDALDTGIEAVINTIKKIRSGGDKRHKTTDLNVHLVLDAGKATLASENYLHAIPFFAAARFLDRQNAEVHYNFGLAVGHNDDTDCTQAAIQSLEKAFTLQATPKYFKALVEIYFRTADYESIIRLEKQEDATDLVDDDTKLMIGDAYLELGEHDRAIEMYEKMGYAPNNPMSRVAQAEAFALIERYDDALKLLEGTRTLLKDPSTPEKARENQEIMKQIKARLMKKQDNAHPVWYALIDPKFDSVMGYFTQ